ncbi:hypothetical protein GCM10029964_104120 [Kibdelosporangium lantanae]
MGLGLCGGHAGLLERLGLCLWGRGCGDGGWVVAVSGTRFLGDGMGWLGGCWVERVMVLWLLVIGGMVTWRWMTVVRVRFLAVDG